MSDLFSLSVHEITKKIKEGKLTSVEICKSYIDRINKFEKEVKAWAYFDKKLLLEKAEEAENHRRSGKNTGILHGIPVAIKEIVGTFDMPTECGNVLRKGKTQSQNGEIVDLLKSEGGIIMGKNVISELVYLGPLEKRKLYEYNRNWGGFLSGLGGGIEFNMGLIINWI
jgi:Asp-tRNAAsn/Glu-tRNAGln amidotransferase A subunit and related amidases